MGCIGLILIACAAYYLFGWAGVVLWLGVVALLMSEDGAEHTH